MKKIIYSVMLLSILFSMSAAAQKIYINPGHGAYTSEDRNVRTINYALGDHNGFWESKMNCTKGNYLYDFLVGNGFAAQRSRTTTGAGLDHGLSTIASWANNYGANVFLSIHSNAANQSANYGLICFNGTTSAPKYPASKTFGNAVWDKMLTNNLTNYTAYSITNRNVCGDVTRLGFNLGVLRPLTRPGILTEATFHDYRPETHRFLSNAYCRMESWNLYRGICAYFGKGIPNGATNGKGGAVVGWVRENVGFSHAQYFNARGDDTKLPLNGVKVELLNSSGGVAQSMTTDGQYNGVYGFYNIQAGTYSLRFSKSGYNCLKTGTFSVTAGGATYRKEWMSKGSNNSCGSNPALTLWLSSQSSVDSPIGNSQPAGKTVYLYMKDHNGGNVQKVNCDLTSSNTAVATINTTGDIALKAAGTTTITAVRARGVADNAKGTLTITVTGPPTLSLWLSAESSKDVPIGNSQVAGKTVYLYLKDSNGGNVQKVNCDLTSSNTAVATINTVGDINTIAAGSTTIKAVRKSDKATGQLTLTVTGSSTLTLWLSSDSAKDVPVGNSQAAGKTVYLYIKGSNGAAVNRLDCNLTSSNTGVASISIYGTITTVAAGTTTITAVRKSDNVKGTLALTVTGGTPTLTLSLSSSSTTNVPVSNTQTTGKTVYLYMVDNTGGFANNGNSTLTSSNTAVATIDGYGTITTKAAGTTTIKAVRNGGVNNQGLKDGATGTLTLTVTAIPTLTLSLSSSSTANVPISNTQPAGQTIYLYMIDNTGGFAHNGNSTLTSSNTAVATIDGYGTIATKAAGTTTIKAVRNGGVNNQGLKDGATGTLTLTVTGTPPSTGGLTLNLTSESLNNVIIGNSQPAKKTVYLWIKDSGSGAVVNRLDCDLSSSNAAVATISIYGTITTVAAGTTTITAVRKSDKKSGTLTLTVTAAAQVIADPTDLSTPEKEKDMEIFATETGISVQFEGDALVELYTISGMLIDKAIASQSYSRDLDKGIYIIRVNGETKKFVR